MQCVVFAGGRATRLGQLAKETPKYLLSVGGKVFADWHLSWLKSNGLSRVVLLVGYLGSKIEQFVGSGERWELDISVLRDPTPDCGTGGALRNAILSDQLDEMFLVTYGDTLLDLNFSSFVASSRQSASDILMSVIESSNTGHRPNCRFETSTNIRYSKKIRDDAFDLVEYGLLAIRRDNIKSVLEAGHEFSDVIEMLADEDRVEGYLVSNPFKDIGTPETLAKTDAWLRSRSQRGPASHG